MKRLLATRGARWCLFHSLLCLYTNKMYTHMDLSLYTYFGLYLIFVRFFTNSCVFYFLQLQKVYVGQYTKY